MIQFATGLLEPSVVLSSTQSVLFAVSLVAGSIGTVAGPVVGTLLRQPIQHFALTEPGGCLGTITDVGCGSLLVLRIVHAPERVMKLRGFDGAIESRLPTFTAGSEESEADRSARSV